VSRVFVSYANEDLALAREVCDWLHGEGHDVFLDRDLRNGIIVGEEWRQRLHERLRWADAVVCIVTLAYRASTWCTAEVATAQSRGSQLLPLCAEAHVTHPLLTEVQHTDLVRDQVAARAAVAEALRRIDVAGGSSWPDDRSPFPGLRPFDPDWHRVFFGRTYEVRQLVELLRSPADRAEGSVLLVVGPSGCGKSSLVRAGLLPRMAGERGWWTLQPIVPGTDPVSVLVRELATAARQLSLGWTARQVRHQLGHGGLTELFDELLLAAPGKPQNLLIVVDQFEELLTHTAPGDRSHFVELLRPALNGSVHVVATLRPEFLGQLLVGRKLAGLPTRPRPYTLRPLDREALRAVIEEPARIAGLGVESDLVADLVADTGSGDALPLLAFTLAQLADGVGRGGQLSNTRYDQLGKVQGALIRQADAALADAVAAGGRSREEVIAGLLRLVTVDEGGRPTRWRISRDELPTSVATELDAFVGRRLLITDISSGGAVIGVAHEAFLSEWPPLAEAITASASALRARRSVEHAASEWDDNGRPQSQLWGAGQLAAAVTDTGTRIYTRRVLSGAPSPPQKYGLSRSLPRRHQVLVTERVDLSLKARDFLHASIRRDRYRRRRVTTVLSVLLILATLAAGIAIIQQRDAQEQQRIATARQLVAQADAIRNTNPRTALRLGIAAHNIAPGDETRSSLVNNLTATRYSSTLSGHSSSVNSVAFSPDGRTLASGEGNGTVILWDVGDRARPRELGQPLAGLSS
jgi:energy-coupling factor transporter ATP-binding protein EcfA2